MPPETMHNSKCAKKKTYLRTRAWTLARHGRLWGHRVHLPGAGDGSGHSHLARGVGGRHWRRHRRLGGGRRPGPHWAARGFLGWPGLPRNLLKLAGPPRHGLVALSDASRRQGRLQARREFRHGDTPAIIQVQQLEELINVLGPFGQDGVHRSGKFFPVHGAAPVRVELAEGLGDHRLYVAAVLGLGQGGEERLDLFLIEISG
mmetsp:Transcript_58800/g.128872  ORF Transcript_58800/g.128872 Transcript_58800/m.128872 type:complete len:203 (-) Transcript_58800:58-666(-)